MRISPQRKNQSGIAVLLVLVMISFMLAFVMANSNALFQLKREVKLVDQQQKKRWKDLDGTSKTNEVGKLQK